MKKLFRFGCLFLSILFLMCGCGKRDSRGAGETVEALLALCGEYPVGILYPKGAQEGEDGYLREDDFDLLYGEGSAAEYLPLVEDYALYLSSFAIPFEIAVFRCYERSDATRLGGMLLRRADTLKVLLRALGQYETYGECISVTVIRKYAILVMSPHLPDRGELSRAVMG